jgi:hypothetical protein
MDAAIVSWLDRIGSMAFAWSLALFVAVNGAAAVVFLIGRDRATVNTWTGRLLAVDLLLVGTGVGIPVTATLARVTVSAVSASVHSAGFGLKPMDDARSLEPVSR